MVKTIATLLLFTLSATILANSIAPQDTQLLWQGRTENLSSGGKRFSYPGVSVQFNFDGTSVAINAESSSGNNYVSVWLDDQPEKIIKLPNKGKTISLLNDTQPKRHHVRIVNRNETWQGVVTLHHIQLKGKLLPPPKSPKRKLLVIGDSVTCAEAIDRTPACTKNTSWSNPEKSYSFLLASQLKAQIHLVCYGGRGLVRSWNGKTDEFNIPQIFTYAIPTAENPVDWDHRLYQPDLILINVGTNDFALNIPDTPVKAHYVARYIEFIKSVRQHHPKSEIVITDGPIVNNNDAKRPQKAILQGYLTDVVAMMADKKIHYIPSNIYPGDSCDGHPTAQQHEKIAADMAGELQKLHIISKIKR